VAKVLDVEIEFGRDGRPSGTATVLFGSHADAKAALVKNRETMGSRSVFASVLRIHDILVWIPIRGSMPLTNGFGSESPY
jgi:hypothetical protein